MPPDFQKLIVARFLYTFAVQMQAVILGWRIYELLEDPLSLGFIGLAEAVPAIGLALYAGFLVDRMRPLLVYRGVIYISLLSGAVVLTEHLAAHELSLTWQAGSLYFAAFLTGAARAFSQPSIFASVPRLVHRDDLLRATAISGSTMQMARIIGPAFGGLTFGFLGPVVSSTIVCVLLGAGVFVMTTIVTDIPAPDSRFLHASVKDELLSGGRFVWRHPILFPALTLDMISVMFGGVTGLLPIFAKDILDVGAKASARYAPHRPSARPAWESILRIKARCAPARVADRRDRVRRVHLGLRRQPEFLVVARGVRTERRVRQRQHGHSLVGRAVDLARAYAGENFSGQFDLHRVVERDRRVRVRHRGQAARHATGRLSRRPGLFGDGRSRRLARADAATHGFTAVGTAVVGLISPRRNGW
ncbi:MAG: MFS transporter [Pirellulales bacterium]